MSFMNKHSPDAQAYLRTLSDSDFMALGVRQIAYVKPMLVDDRMAFVVHAADGTPLSVHEEAKDALSTARIHELYPVTLH
jgi:hypothetical protein